MDDYLPKPYTREQLREMLKTWLDLSALVSSQIGDSGSPPKAATPMPSEPINDKVLADLNQTRDLAPRGDPTIPRENTGPPPKPGTRCIANGDITLLCNVSHRLKSSSAMVGAVVLSSRCRQLETMALAGANPDAPALVKAIIVDYNTASVALSARLRQLA